MAAQQRAVQMPDALGASVVALASLDMSGVVRMPHQHQHHTTRIRIRGGSDQHGVWHGPNCRLQLQAMSMHALYRGTAKGHGPMTEGNPSNPKPIPAR